MIATERLVLRPFRDADRDPWAAMNADPEVMRHFPAPLTREEADALIDRVNARIAETGAGFWAMERAQDGAFLGFAGLNCIGHDIPLKGEWEVGWRLTRHAWGQGYASEAGRAALAYGFGAMGLTRIIAYTAITNLPSVKVMQRIGMEAAPEQDFDHPAIAEGSTLCRHIVFAKSR